MANLEFKDFSFEVKGVDSEQRIVEGYASTYDKDQVDDIVMPGAFTKSLQERFPAGKIKLLWQHMDPIGIPVEMQEDDKGLYVKCRVSQTQLGDDALQLVKDGVIDRFSIGFSVPRDKARVDDDGTRRISEVKLYEVSLVTFAANEAAVLTAVKSLRQKCDSITSEPYGVEYTEHSESGESAPSEKGPPSTGEEDPEELKALIQSFEELSEYARNRLY